MIPYANSMKFINSRIEPLMKAIMILVGGAQEYYEVVPDVAAELGHEGSPMSRASEGTLRGFTQK
jgi:hypothetical protein